MQAVLPIFLLMKVVNWSLLSPHIDLIMPIMIMVVMIAVQIAAILMSLLEKVYSLRKMGITASSAIETSCHPSFQGFIARISR
jgi:hypothetical protein